MKATTPALLAIVAIVAAASVSVRAAPVLPDFSNAVFHVEQEVDNPYFPMSPGMKYVYRGRDEDGPIGERFELTNIGLGPVILGVQSRIQLDREFEDGLLMEETSDYFAQDTDGNVWYLGEDVTKYVYDDDGNLIGTNSGGAWRAGVNGAMPGYIMPADLMIGFNYYQEHAPNDDALDQGTISALGEVLDLEMGTFEDVLRIFESTELELDAREFKYYVPGIGLLVAAEDLDEDLANPETIFELTAIRAVPEPGSWMLVALGLAGLVPMRRRRST